MDTGPPPPTNIAGERIEPSKIKVTWTIPMVAISGYKIYYTTQDTGTDSDEWKEVEVGTANAYILTDLDEYRAYAIKVCILFKA